jgi:hypothetical protein
LRNLAGSEARGEEAMVDNSEKKLLEIGKVRTVGGKSVSRITFSKDSK